MFYPWNNIQSLRQYLLLNAPKKSYHKRLEILESYFSNHVFQDKELSEILHSTVTNIYNQVWGPDRSNNRLHSNMSLLCSISDATKFHRRMEGN